MKRIAMSLSLLGLLFAFTATGVARSGQAAKSAKAYACPKCEVASAKSGKCACGEQMIAVNGRTAYACAKCAKSSAKPGKCPACGGEMHKSLITYACEACKVSSAKPGDCKMCKDKLKKHVVPYH